MISTSSIGLSFGSRTLFEKVNVKFLEGNCYGLIGANGAGKSTFLKILSGDIDSTEGHVHIEPGKRIAVLKQDQFAYDERPVLETVLMGHKTLYEIYAERMVLYAKEDLTESEGMRIGELEEAYGEMDGYVQESNAASMLNELGISDELHENLMSSLDAGEKIRVLLAQALFGDPDVLLLDEPTNQLDYSTTLWLENYLLEFKNTVVVVSHDRHFLNKVCTHIADVDYGKINIYPGNYSFWKNATALARSQQEDQNKKAESKIKELEDFVARFSANASKSKQATSRKKLIDKLKPEDLPVSSRRAPYIHFKSKRSCGKSVLTVKDVSHSIEGEKVLNRVSFVLEQGDKMAIAGKNSVSKTTFLKILAGEIKPDEGSVKWGESITPSYFPKDNSAYFESGVELLAWLQEYHDSDDDQFFRGFLGRMLFSGDDVKKKVSVLSGGEKARAMFSKMMLAEGNCLVFDEPTDHLDLESITSLNEGLEEFEDCLVFSSHDFQLLSTVSNRVVEVTPKGSLYQSCGFEEYMQSDRIRKKRELLY